MAEPKFNQIPSEETEKQKEALQEALRGIGYFDQNRENITAMRSGYIRREFYVRREFVAAEAKLGLLDEARQDGEHDIDALNSIAIAEAGAGLDPLPTFNEAKEIARQLLEDDPDEGENALRDIAIAEAKAGLLAQAGNDAEQMERVVNYGGVWEAIAFAEAKAGRIDEAKADLEKIEDKEVHAEALAGIIKAEAEAGLFSQAKTDTKNILHESFREEALVNIAVAEASQYMLENAARTAEQIESKEKRIEAYRTIIEAAAERGIRSEEHESIRRIIQRAKLEADAMKHRADIARGYCEIAIAEARAGFDSRPSFARAKQHTPHIEEPAYEQSAIFEDIAIAEAKAGFFEEARQDARSILERFPRENALEIITVVEIDATEKRITETMKNLKDIPEEKLNALLASLPEEQASRMRELVQFWHRK